MFYSKKGGYVKRGSVKKSSSTKRRSIKRRSTKKRSKSKVRIIVTKGKLYGYHVDNLQRDRRSLLKKILKNKWATFSEIIKRLNTLAIYNMNRYPEKTEKIRKDMKYVETELIKYSKVYKRRSAKKKRKSLKKTN